MSKRVTQPVVLTIAGSDSGGGAGIQADLKTFAALNTHGASAITCLTAQNPKGVRGIHACPADMVQLQIEAVCDELHPAAVKTGMLYSADIIRVVADWRRHHCAPVKASRSPHKHVPVFIVDPVMVATSGARLLKESAIASMQEDLLPLADLVTPNLDEAAILVGHPVTNLEEARQAAWEIQERYHCATLLKGGHLKGLKEAVDFFFDGSEELMLSAPFVKGVSTHGTGCTYSAAIAAYAARGHSLPEAVTLAKEYITQAIAQSIRVHKFSVLNNLWK